MTHVLLIEPDRPLGKTYKAMLEADGLTVVVCTSAQAAITAADAVRPDIVVLELQLVNHSGIEFLYEFRSYTDWQEVPIIICTHVPSSEFAGARRLMRSDLGVAGYLYKPTMTLEKLRRSVRAAMPLPTP